MSSRIAWSSAAALPRDRVLTDLGERRGRERLDLLARGGQGEGCRRGLDRGRGPRMVRGRCTRSQGDDQNDGRDQTVVSLHPALHSDDPVAVMSCGTRWDHARQAVADRNADGDRLPGLRPSSAGPQRCAVDAADAIAPPEARERAAAAALSPWRGLARSSQSFFHSPGCQGPENPKPNARTFEPSASAIARPWEPPGTMYAIWDPSGDQYGLNPPVITFVKSEPSGATV